MDFPEFYRVKQSFKKTNIKDVQAKVLSELNSSNITGQVISGETVAIAVGSRGIVNLKIIVKTTIEYLKSLGLKPFIFPAMGSHGGALAEGQLEVLEGLGISEESMEVPIISSTEVVSIGRLSTGADVFFSKDALKADHVIVINRVKLHPIINADIESGLCKMLAVGCGKPKGATIMHRYGLASAIIEASRVIIEKTHILAGLAVVENGLHQTHKIEVVNPEKFIETDRRLLKEAKRLFPRIPLNDLDVLLVNEMGKNISGGGMDIDVYGYWRRDGGKRIPDYRILIVLDLTEESHGNAIGIGMADLTTLRVRKMIDEKATYKNAITSGMLRAARIPIALQDDREVIKVALEQCIDNNVRMVIIKNTNELATFWATKILLQELEAMGDGIIIDNTPLELRFDESNRLVLFE